jgi:ribonuclease PH
MPRASNRESVMRPSGRNLDEIREISIEIGATKHAEGSCLIKCGDTQVLCTASLEERVPPFLKNTGWAGSRRNTGCCRARPTRGCGARLRPASNRAHAGNSASDRSLAARGHRPLGAGRAADHRGLRRDPGRWRHALRLDHGGWVALRLAVNKLLKAGDIVSDPITDHVAAVSCGIYAGQPVLDLDYAEDSEAGTDSNFVMTGAGALIEVQASAEGAAFSRGRVRRDARPRRQGDRSAGRGAGPGRRLTCGASPG